MDQRALGQTLYSSVKIPLRGSILLHQEKGWNPLTGPRLPGAERMDSPRRLPPPRYHFPNTKSHWEMPLYEIRRPMGVPQCPYQRRRSMESCIQDAPRPLRTHGHAIWSVQCFCNLPAGDGSYPPTPQTKAPLHDICLHGRHPDCHSE